MELAGGLYHVMSRGNERRAIVRDDADRQRRLDWLQQAVESQGWRLHAFVLMSNHEHLFVETPEPNLSEGMHLLNSSYTSYFNRRHRRAGHLFQGRFKAHLIEEEGHFTEVSRYIHLNPVRARLVERPEEWIWSSYAGYRSSNAAREWLSYERVLREFGRNKAESRRRYVRFVRAGLANPPRCPWADAVGGLIVGSERFVARVQRLVAGRPADPEVPQVRRLRQQPSLERIAAVAAEFGRHEGGWPCGTRCDDMSRALAAYLARHCYGYGAGAVARALDYRGHSSVRAAVLRVEASREKLGRALKALQKKLTID
jgi:REP element-mobilizing transposase RayT